MAEAKRPKRRRARVMEKTRSKNQRKKAKAKKQSKQKLQKSWGKAKGPNPKSKGLTNQKSKRKSKGPITSSRDQSKVQTTNLKSRSASGFTGKRASAVMTGQFFHRKGLVNGFFGKNVARFNPNLSTEERIACGCMRPKLQPQLPATQTFLFLF